MVLVPVAKLEQVCADTFARIGSTPEEALRVARELYRSEEAHREQPGRTEKEATSQCN